MSDAHTLRLPSFCRVFTWTAAGVGNGGPLTVSVLEEVAPFDDWGDRLRRRRLRAGLTQAELAAACQDALGAHTAGRGVHQADVSRWESNARRPSDDQKVALARVLGTRVATLFPYPDGV